MEFSKRQSYRRRAQRAGKVFVICAFIFSFFVRLGLLLGDRGANWLGMIAGSSFLIGFISGVVGLVAFGFSLFKPRDGEVAIESAVPGIETHASPIESEPPACDITSRQKWGRAILATSLTLFFLFGLLSNLRILYEFDFEIFLVTAVGGKLALVAALFIAIWFGSWRARWIFIVWQGAEIIVLHLPRVIARGDRFGYAHCFISFLLISPLIFSRAVASFQAYQRSRRPPMAPARRRKILAIGAGLAVIVIAFGTILYLHVRNHWPEKVTERLAALRQEGLPLTLAECDARYRVLTANSSVALQHFEKIFAALPSQQPPLSRSPKIKHLGARPELLDLSKIESKKFRTAVISCLQSNAVALRLLHEAAGFERCAFPIKITEGTRALLPHLPLCLRAGQLLALESVERAWETNSAQSAQSIVALLHLSEILRDDPMLIGSFDRDRLVAAACVAFHTAVNRISFSTADLKLISERLQRAMMINDAVLTNGIVTERCELIDVFMGGSREIAELLFEGRSGPLPRLSVEIYRGTGGLQNDAGTFLEYMDKVDSAVSLPDRNDTITRLAEIEGVFKEKKFSKSNPLHGNYISRAFLPFTLRAMQAHQWTQNLGDVTLTALAVERYHNDTGKWPDALKALVPKYLSEVPKDPYGRNEFVLQSASNGYALSTTGDFGDLDKNDMETQTNEIVFRVER